MLDAVEPDAPPVLFWYRIYAGLMALLYVLVSAGGVLMTSFGALGPHDPPPWFMITVFACASLPFAAAFGAAFFLPRRPWAWIYHLVLISIGLTSPCCMPASIPLLIFWIKPETKRYFGRD